MTGAYLIAVLCCVLFTDTLGSNGVERATIGSVDDGERVKFAVVGVASFIGLMIIKAVAKKLSPKKQSVKEVAALSVAAGGNLAADKSVVSRDSSAPSFASI
mmetsp:Transcript_19812/g.35238  ORF Transcript_19812/g.35238 Transcript_19812/m.35238 type:complete len:102 (-) Transcript_19812:131-436(-)|eukprot:CAMPEP_0184527226 /NCGR_PEP_ID=MMETSP0198_2-20121128/11081_1 /TAXON_ID=1112570 /ORGANISM="Thraustochytrium sp., Strain LLF1b" /LENGTH=101 /DNA_ID=CAMNT_0026918863 /DNA_START=221 /DNA_END=526 /DNA_ORIENTATION=+